MLEILDFMKKYEGKITYFTQSFNNLLTTAIQKLSGHYPNDAITYLDQAHKDLKGMKHIYEKIKDFEKYLIKFNKKTIKDLKKEKV